jgi:hypothetical protein
VAWIWLALKITVREVLKKLGWACGLDMTGSEDNIKRGFKETRVSVWRDMAGSEDNIKGGFKETRVSVWAGYGWLWIESRDGQLRARRTVVYCTVCQLTGRLTHKTRCSLARVSDDACRDCVRSRLYCAPLGAMLARTGCQEDCTGNPMALLPSDVVHCWKLPEAGVVKMLSTELQLCTQLCYAAFWVRASRKLAIVS